MSDAFRVAARGASAVLGSAWAFAVAVLILIWIATRPAFQYSDTWQLIINTGTTIVTFLRTWPSSRKKQTAEAIPDVKKFAANTAKIIQKHLDLAKQTQSKLK